MAKDFLYYGTDGFHRQSASYESSDFTSTFTGTANEPVLTDASGYLNNFLDTSAIDHGGLAGLSDDDHTQYILADGTRAFSGDQSMGSFKITNLAAGSSANDAVNYSQLQAVLTNRDWKDSVRVVADSNTALSGGATLSIDSVSLANDDRVLLVGQTDASENGIYVVSGIGSAYALTRSTDADEDAEVTSGLTTYAEEGTVYAETEWFISTPDPITVDTTNITFNRAPRAVTTASLGVERVGNDFRADLLASGGLKLTGNELGVEPNDFAGEGLIDDGSDNLAIDWSTAFNDSKAVKASDLSSTSNGYGASIIGIEDSGGNFVATNVEAALAELAGQITERGVEYTVGTGGVSKTDAVYVSGADTVSVYSTISTAQFVVGLAASTEIQGATVKVLANDTVLDGFTGLTAGTRYYWTGSGWTNDFTSYSAGEYRWLGGVAKSTTEVHVDVLYLGQES